MEPHARQLEISSVDGKFHFTVIVTEKPAAVPSGDRAASPKKPTPKEDKNHAKNQNGEVPMTEAQKRYLFRILADQGFEGEKAFDRLTGLFRVTSLKDVTKAEASRMIERLLEETKGAGNA